jgi:hypothetical protein
VYPKLRFELIREIAGVGSASRVAGLYSLLILPNIAAAAATRDWSVGVSIAGK